MLTTRDFRFAILLENLFQSSYSPTRAKPPVDDATRKEMLDKLFSTAQSDALRTYVVQTKQLAKAVWRLNLFARTDGILALASSIGMADKHSPQGGREFKAWQDMQRKKYEMFGTVYQMNGDERQEKRAFEKWQHWKDKESGAFYEKRKIREKEREERGKGKPTGFFVGGRGGLVIIIRIGKL